MQAQGRTTILRLNYRNTLEILSVARQFAREILAERAEDDDHIPLVAPESAGRRGAAPELVRSAGAGEELRTLVTALGDEHAHGRAWADMAVIFRDRWQGPAIARELARAGIPHSLAEGTGKHALFAAGDTVKLLTMHSSKGLEFPFVVIPGLCKLPKPAEDEAEPARLLYVAMTRATGYLMLLHHGESAFTRRIRASINEVQEQLGAIRDPATAPVC